MGKARLDAPGSGGEKSDFFSILLEEAINGKRGVGPHAARSAEPSFGAGPADSLA